MVLNLCAIKIVIETGTHENLIRQMGLYYAMWRQQIGERKKVSIQPVLN